MVLWYPFSKIYDKCLTTNSQISGYENIVRFQISLVAIAMKNDSGTTENNVLKYQKLWEMLSTNSFLLKPHSCGRLRRYNIKYWPSTLEKNGRYHYLRAPRNLSRNVHFSDCSWYIEIESFSWSLCFMWVLYLWVPKHLFICCVSL